MKIHGMFAVFLTFLVCFFQCKYEEKTLVSGEIPVEDCVSGPWLVSITVGKGSHLPDGTTLSAVMSLDQGEAGEVIGSIVIGDDLQGYVNGTVSGHEFQFRINQSSGCHVEYVGSGKANQECTKLSGSYSGTDCLGTINANFTATRLTTML